jgi:hypothetical protein
MTLATDMYYSSYHVNTGKPVHVPRGADEKAMQRALLQPHLLPYRDLARKARELAGAPPPPKRRSPRAERVRPSDSFED